MTSPHSKQKLSQAEDIAHAIGAGQPELGVPCLDLVTVFEELKATDTEADNLWDDLRSLQAQADAIDKPPIHALNTLIGKITAIFEHLAAYRIKRRMMDALALKLHFTTKWVTDRVNVLDDAHAQFQLAVQEYRRETKAHAEHMERVITRGSRNQAASLDEVDDPHTL